MVIHCGICREVGDDDMLDAFHPDLIYGGLIVLGTYIYLDSEVGQSSTVLEMGGSFSLSIPAYLT